MISVHRLEAFAVPGVPRIAPGDDLVEVVGVALSAAGVELRPGDVLVVSSKLLSRAEGRFVDLEQVVAGEEARALAARTGHDPRLVQLVLAESERVSRAAPGVLVVRHRLGFVGANAGIDRSNADGRVLLLPTDPDEGARRLLALADGIGVVVTDSMGRPFRVGTVGQAIGVAGLPALYDQRGREDLDGRPLEHTVTALADQVAAAADLVAGQADEGRGVVVVRGLTFDPVESSARALVRPADQDLYA